MTSMQSAFHLRELPSGGRQTSPELLCVCSSHPCRAVSLTHNPADLVYRSPISVPPKPAACWMEAENNDSHTHTLQSPCTRSPCSSATPQVAAAQASSLSSKLTVMLRPLKTESRTARRESRVLCEVKEVAQSNLWLSPEIWWRLV